MSHDGRTPASHDQLIRNLHRANAVAQRARANGTHPFGSVLVGPDHETVLLEQGNVDVVNHAESVLARRAHEAFTKQNQYKKASSKFPIAWAELSGEEFLWRCTLYSTFEPCAMCAATQYWANIGTLVYACSEEQLLALTGSSSKNPTLNVPSRYVFEHSQKHIAVVGPVADGRAKAKASQELVGAVLDVHRGFWDDQAAEKKQRSKL